MVFSLGRKRGRTGRVFPPPAGFFLPLPGLFHLDVATWTCDVTPWDHGGHGVTSWAPERAPKSRFLVSHFMEGFSCHLYSEVYLRVWDQSTKKIWSPTWNNQLQFKNALEDVWIDPHPNGESLQYSQYGRNYYVIMCYPWLSISIHKLDTLVPSWK